jgi:uncharacterized cupredoxin-like copper-binding protein
MRRNRLWLLAPAALAAALTWAIPAGAQQAKVAATTVSVTAGKPTEFRFKLSKSSAAKGKVTFVVTNRGNLPHDFKIAGKVTKLVSPGKSARLVVVFGKPGKFRYLCTVPGHAAAGMKGTFVVK